MNSYLNYLKISPEGEGGGGSEGGGGEGGGDEGEGEKSTVFIEAAMMIQNVNIIYQKKVDSIVDETMKLVAKFKS